MTIEGGGGNTEDSSFLWNLLKFLNDLKRNNQKAGRASMNTPRIDEYVRRKQEEAGSPPWEDRT